MEGAIKLARQYFYETCTYHILPSPSVPRWLTQLALAQPKRTNFIARKLSYHGNTVSTLSLADHNARRVPYEPILDHDHFHHVSAAYAKRYQRHDETEEQYVSRLAVELEQKFQELGPQTVIACE